MRGGTSFATGMLYHMGINVGDSFRRSNEKNPKGFFEDETVFWLNESILKRMGGRDCQNWNPPKEFPEDAAKPYTNQLEALRRRRGIWARKGGFNFTIDYYLPYLSNPHLIITYRNPIGNIRSIKDYFGWDFQTANKILLIHYNQLANVTEKDLPIYFFEFERARQAPVEVAREMAEFIGIEFNHEEAIKNFVYQKR